MRELLRRRPSATRLHPYLRYPVQQRSHAPPGRVAACSMRWDRCELAQLAMQRLLLLEHRRHRGTFGLDSRQHLVHFPHLGFLFCNQRLCLVDRPLKRSESECADAAS